MNDFASAAMMRLIGLGLARQGLVEKTPETPAQAHVPLAEKRELAGTLLRKYGAVALLRIGEAVEGAPEEPLMTALSLARDPRDLMLRWQRLERFVHSRHRTEIVAQSEIGFVLRHKSLQSQAPPNRAEDLLVFGLLFALFRHCGAGGLKARPEGTRKWWLSKGDWSPGRRPSDFSTWEVVWSALRQARFDLQAGDDDAGWADMVRRAIAADPGRMWTARKLSEELRLSARTLQRRLKAEGSSVAKLLAVTRLNAASAMLGTTDATLAEIGYACGFSDQSHFTREFRKHTGATPSTFRSEFAA